jgi:hypothetical protein
MSYVPEQYRNFASWPVLEESLLSAQNQARYRRFSHGIEMKLAGQTTEAAAAVAKISEKEFMRIFKRCLSQHADGRIWGLRALIKGVRVQRPRRTSPLKIVEDKPGAGYSGLFGKVLDDHPKIEPDLLYQLVTARRLMLSPNRATMRWCHRVFLRLCEEQCVTKDEYPFNTQTQGRRAFQLWMRNHFLPKHATAWTVAELGTAAAQPFVYQGGDGSATALANPYEVWQIDEVTIDETARYELPNWSGDWEQMDLRRCTAIRVIETGATTTLAWRLVLAAQPTVEELLMVLWDAMNGPPKVPGTVPDLDYMDGAGYPANIHPVLRFAVPKFIELDNALSHLAGALQRLVAGTLGSVVRLGAPRTPQARGKVEAKFKLQAQRVLHQLPGTTGSGPGDPVRKKAAVPVHKRVRVDELEHVLDCYIANENTTPAAGAGYEAPIERLRRQIEAGAIRVNYLPTARRKAHFFNSLHPVKLKVDPKSRRRPFINFLGVRYTSAQLQRAYTLVNQPLWVRFDPRDLRVLLVFLDDGSEFGAITAMGQWGKFQHDLRIRKLFLKLKRQGELGARPEDEPLEALFVHLRANAPRDRNKALQLAHLMAVLVRPMEGTEHVQQLVDAEREAQAELAKSETVAALTPAELPDLPATRVPVVAANESQLASASVKRLPRRIQRR